MKSIKHSQYLFPLNKTLSAHRTRLMDHINAIPSDSKESVFANRGYMLHLALYGLSLMGELNDLRK